MSNIDDALGISSTTPPASAVHDGATSSFSSRYADGYTAAGFIVGFGTVIKVVSFIAGALVLMGFIASNFHMGVASSVAGFAGMIFGALIAFVGFIAGVMVSAQGQMLKATLDSAVNTSPFLENQERRRIMRA
jgi:hypothetical protein